MNLESLANELLLDLFDYFNSIELFRSFSELNIRFNNLLFQHYRSHHIDLRSITKQDFDEICRKYLPEMTDRVISLHLSDDDETPYQLTSFLSYNLKIPDFHRLKRLSLIHIRSMNIMNDLLRQLKFLPDLKHLEIIDCNFRLSYFHIIWCQRQLTHFKLEKLASIDFTVNNISSSIQNLILHSNLTQFHSLDRLLTSTPHLRHLSVVLTFNMNFSPFSFIGSSLKSLHLVYSSSFDFLDELLERFPNLKQLKIQTEYIEINGYRWEKIIRNDLSKLKIFELMMEFDTPWNLNKENQVDVILESFRTSFWLIEHQWFVRCHYYNKSLCLYTLPCTFPKSFQYLDKPFQSTCSHSTHLLKIHHIDVLFPSINPFWMNTVDISQLRSISIQISDDLSIQSQLQSLFDRATNLYSLRLYSKHFSRQFFLDKITSESIRRLDLRSIYLYANENICQQLCKTSLVNQCEVLLIHVENRSEILFLINHMKNLRALYVHSKVSVDQTNPYYPSIFIDELIQWLKQQLPTSFAISPDEYFPSCVRIWISYVQFSNE
ncbi:unnamed protein product [Adineta ricciae]|uniref:F-box domain-containing protein n=2 Tax=Adineta ricciae TaxID=249248 RepID=A0A815HVK6_ADIRI|nr:unnamed protein product [Adineta ricciae]